MVGTAATGCGALPLEAQRLGLESNASDLNPVAEPLSGGEGGTKALFNCLICGVSCYNSNRDDTGSGSGGDRSRDVGTVPLTLF